LRQLSRFLNKDILSVGKAMYPFVRQGWIQMLNPIMVSSPNQTTDLQFLGVAAIPRIVCIDDAIAICETIESILKLQGYDALGCTNPLQAFNLVFQFKPDLILCDIAMPELDGYELCAMLRHSSKFRHTPIVMLTGKDQFIDRVKAKMVGATDYLTKPFVDNELLMLVEKHLPVSSNNFAKQEFVTTSQ
jgi:twitching motility two-component system response regulator PilG